MSQSKPEILRVITKRVCMDAIQWFPTQECNISEWGLASWPCGVVQMPSTIMGGILKYSLENRESIFTVMPGDFIVSMPNGDKFVVSPSDFSKLYDITISR